MNQLRTIKRASNWTPDRLRVLSAIVVAAEHVSEDPLGRVEGVVLDERDEIQSFIVTLWAKGLAEQAVLVPLAGVRWYTEGFAPALGIAWTPETLRRQPVIVPSSGPRRPSLTVVAHAPDLEAASSPRARRAMLVGLLGAAAGATLGALLLDPLLAAGLALLVAPVAAALGARRAPAAAPVRSAAALARDPWVVDLEQNLLCPSAAERRVLRFSLLRPTAAPRPVLAPASGRAPGLRTVSQG